MNIEISKLYGETIFPDRDIRGSLLQIEEGKVRIIYYDMKSTPIDQDGYDWDIPEGSIFQLSREMWNRHIVDITYKDFSKWVGANAETFNPKLLSYIIDLVLKAQKEIINYETANFELPFWR